MRLGDPQALLDRVLIQLVDQPVGRLPVKRAITGRSVRSDAVSGTCLTQTTMFTSDACLQLWDLVSWLWYSVPPMATSSIGPRDRVKLALMSKESPRDRLAEAAFALFDERGYEQTTVDDITERAGLGRTTFFRYYRSKEDVIFPDHDRLLDLVRDRLLTSSHHTVLAAVSDAVRLVLLHYLEEGDLARRRYALTSTAPTLRDREIASVARYQRLFREFIADWMGEPGRTRLAAGRAHGGCRRGGAQPRAAPLAARREPGPGPRIRRRHAAGDHPVRRRRSRVPATEPRSSRSAPARTSTRCFPRCGASSRPRKAPPSDRC